MRLFPLAYAAALLPLFAIHLCYVIAAAAGHVDWCIPYVHSCASISATGRKPAEFFVFKALMLPATVLIAAYWVLWCRSATIGWKMLSNGFSCCCCVFTYWRSASCGGVPTSAPVFLSCADASYFSGLIVTQK